MNEARLGKIYSSLSARELARLKLQLFKNGQPEDLRFQSATSGAQGFEYWQLIGLLRHRRGAGLVPRPPPRTGQGHPAALGDSRRLPRLDAPGR